MTATAALPRSTSTSFLVAVGAGLLAGVAAKAADESGWRWAADLGSYPAAWVLAVALIGRFAPAPLVAAARAAAFFAAMTLAYYAWAAWVLGFGWNRLLPIWLVLSATAVAATAAVASWATGRAGLLPGAAVALAGGIVLAGGEFLPLWYRLTGTGDGAPLVHPVQGVVDAVVALVLVVALPRHRSTRGWGLLLLAPSTAVALRLFDAFGGLIG
ncbi:DUF6518 family protein [Blastococcus sp. TF02A-30]|uniref:DUF6518 family protein n=1 Tax=Blastococcus sp. TF02A-30 TaxID=2250580 RepID=UPI000DE9C08C|nr:DUF6518 family protein [Blastococcus sp. TF02A-30]RBY89418.1 hypothetical protein DQ241_08120 [Blastococcus sp. TF02A-30]